MTKFRRKEIRYGYYQFVRRNLISHIKACAKRNENEEAIEYVQRLKKLVLGYNYN